MRRLPDLPHFECGPFNHLGTSPKYQRYKKTGEKPHRLFSFAAGDRGRTGMRFMSRRILSPVRLPIPPRRQVKMKSQLRRFQCNRIMILNPSLFVNIFLERRVHPTVA